MLVNFRRNSTNSSSSNSFSASSSSCSSDETEGVVGGLGGTLKLLKLKSLGNNKEQNCGQARGRLLGDGGQSQQQQVQRKVHLSYSTPSDFRTGNVKTFTLTKSDRNEFELLSKRGAVEVVPEEVVVQEDEREVHSSTSSVWVRRRMASQGQGRAVDVVQMGLLDSGNSRRRWPRPGSTQRAFTSLQSRIRALRTNCLNDSLRITDPTQPQLQPTINFNKSVELLENLQLKLEYQLETLKNLQIAYNHHLKIREGIRKCAFAHARQRTSHFQETMANIKNGFREANGILLEIESRLETSLMGHFHLELLGIKGFSRLCAGDVYKVTIRHGNQKWRTKGRILNGNGAQKWDLPAASFKSILGEQLSIKVCETTNIFAKQVILVDKSCDLNQELNDHAMNLTLDLNTSGSLKMDLQFRFCPIHKSICTREFDGAGLLMGYDNFPLTAQINGITSGEPIKKIGDRNNFETLIERLEETCSASGEGEENCLEKRIVVDENPIEKELEGLGCESEDEEEYSEHSEDLNSSEADDEPIAEDIKDKILQLQSSLTLKVESGTFLLTHEFTSAMDKLVDVVKTQKEIFRSNKSRSFSEEKLLDEDEELSKCFDFLNMEDDDEPTLLTGSTNLDICLETHIDICTNILNGVETEEGKYKSLAIQTLETQGLIIGKILENRSIIYEELEKLSPEFQHTWRAITSQYCSSVDSIIPIFIENLKSSKLSQKLVSRIFESSLLSSSNLPQVITIFQYTGFIREFSTWKDLKEDLILQNSD